VAMAIVSSKHIAIQFLGIGDNGRPVHFSVNNFRTSKQYARAIVRFG
jgi:hypothetical protein